MDLVRKKQIELWATIFGRDNIILRPYERGQFYQKDVLADFMRHVFDLELNDEFIMPENMANDRLHQVVLEYKKVFNHLDLPSNRKRKIVDPLRDVSSEFNREGRKSFSVFAPQQRRDIISKFAHENTVIARNYLGRKGGVLFFDQLPELDDDWQPYNELLGEDVQKINNHLAQNYPAELDLVVEGILISLVGGEKIRKSALKLLPGISPERVARVLKKILEMSDKQMLKQRQNRINDLYASRTWKAGMVVKHHYERLPSILQKPVLFAARFFIGK